MNQRHKLNTTGVLDKTAGIRSRCQNISRERPTFGATADLSLLLNKTRARRSTHLVVLTTTQPRLTTAVMSHSLLILISQMLIIIVVIVVYLPVMAVGPVLLGIMFVPVDVKVTYCICLEHLEGFSISPQTLTTNKAASLLMGSYSTVILINFIAH